MYFILHYMIIFLKASLKTQSFPIHLGCRAFLVGKKACWIEKNAKFLLVLFNRLTKTDQPYALRLSKAMIWKDS